MGGGLMQLVAYGAQDIYLTGNPQITFFKVVYRRHTNFSMEAIEQTFNGSITKAGSKVTSTISRNGDLITRMWLDIVLHMGTGKNAVMFTNDVGHALLEECELEIGGQLIDRHDSFFSNIYSHLFDWGSGATTGLQNSDQYRNTSRLEFAGAAGARAGTIVNTQLYIPLNFWFCRNPGLALPLIALQYHEVKFKLKTRAIDSLLVFDGKAPGQFTPNPDGTLDPTVKLFADYIYLDTDERRRFAQVSHEYLIEQVQSTTHKYEHTIDLNLNHPVKYLAWVIQHNRVFEDPGIAGVAKDRKVGNNQSYVEGNVAEPADFTSTGLVNQGTEVCKGDYFCYNWLAGKLIDRVQVQGGTAPQGSHIEYLPGSDIGDPLLHGFQTMSLSLNGHERFAPRKPGYFKFCQKLQHDVNPSSDPYVDDIRTDIYDNIYMYSFALKPREHQPSGTCNFSRIDSAQMKFTIQTPVTTPDFGFNNQTLRVYAVNYNVLRIMSGMGGLAYSN